MEMQGQQWDEDRGKEEWIITCWWHVNDQVYSFLMSLKSGCISNLQLPHLFIDTAVTNYEAVLFHCRLFAVGISDIDDKSFFHLQLHVLNCTNLFYITEKVLESNSLHQALYNLKHSGFVLRCCCVRISKRSRSRAMEWLINWK
jgi:hypothetical protein